MLSNTTHRQPNSHTHTHSTAKQVAPTTHYRTNTAPCVVSLDGHTAICHTSKVSMFTLRSNNVVTVDKISSPTGMLVMAHTNSKAITSSDQIKRRANCSCDRESQTELYRVFLLQRSLWIQRDGSEHPMSCTHRSRHMYTVVEITSTMAKHAIG